MKKIIITESQLKKVVDRVLNEGDLFDKGAHFLGLDEQFEYRNVPTTQGTTSKPTTNSSVGSVPSLNGKTVNLYSDTQNGKFYTQVKINKVQKTNDGKIVLYLTNKGDMSITCTNPKKNEFRYLEPVSRKFLTVYNTPLATQLRKLLCTVNASGTTVPKADFASNTQKPTSDFA